MALLPVPLWIGLSENTNRISIAVKLSVLTFLMSLFFCSVCGNDSVVENHNDHTIIWLLKKFRKHFLKKEEPMELAESFNYIYLLILPLQIVTFAVVGLICTEDSILRGDWKPYQDAFIILKHDPFGVGRWWILVGVFVPYVVDVINRVVNKVSLSWKFTAVPLITLAPTCVAIWLLAAQLSIESSKNSGVKYLLLPCMGLWTDEEDKIPSILLWSTCLIVMLMCQVFSGLHIFKRYRHALVSDQKLFYSRGYDGVCLLPSLIYNRKVIEEEMIDTVTSQPRSDLPMIHMCATLYQETMDEMEELFISIFKTERHPDSKGDEILTDHSPAKYDFDVHIMFDDAIKSIKNSTENGPQEIIVHDYVDTMMSAIKNAASIVYDAEIKLKPPTISVTPYGAQMIWETPQKKKQIVIHLKDRTKVRRRKRWSQIMYLYYLLTHKIKLEINNNMQQYKSRTLECPFSEIFTEEVKYQLNNTFLLTLDGDIDWEPISIQLLLNRLLKDENKAAVCARIKPSGNGLVVWYQKIEYAIQHWFAKVSESVFGCVLCAPGCFSLFRAMALIDDNVLKTYSKIPKSAMDMVKCDQGEDRWLCTLLLSSRSGWSIDYCAAASAMANSPATFSEFLEQRRRWISSSVLNQFSFIHNSKQIRAVNPYVHWYFVWLQLLVFVSDVIGPAFVVIYMTSSFSYIGYQENVAFFVCVTPAAIQFYVCMFHSKKVQIFITGLLSAFVTLLFTMSVATSIFAVFNERENYATFVFPVLIGIVVIAGLFHPDESKSLIYLPIYVLGTPITHVLFFIYAACNINDTTWGTREGAKDSTSTGSKKPNILIEITSGIYQKFMRWIRSTGKKEEEEEEKMLVQSTDDHKLEEGNGHMTRTATSTQEDYVVETGSWDYSTTRRRANVRYTTKSKGPILALRHEIEWREPVHDEVTFWESAIKNYNLDPSQDSDPKQVGQNIQLLQDFRNQVVAGFFLIMAIVLVAQYQVTISQNKTGFVLIINFGDVSIRVDYITLCLLAIYTLELGIQFMGFVMHRFYTVFDHLAADDMTEDKWSSEPNTNGRIPLVQRNS